MADSHQSMRCPACQTEMQKIFIAKEGVNIDICVDGCGGMFFDNREFKYVDEQHEQIDEIIAAIEGKTFKKVDESNHRSCPACGARMVKNFSSVKRQVQVDECYSCGGKFLDQEELFKIREEYKTEKDRSQDTVKLMYDTVGKELIQLQQDTEEKRKNRSPLKKLFDSVIYD